jgi:16S rRNA (cytidine1402-2'-O)-methyltransferase
MPGMLYIVSLPIGNVDDITLRAIRVLRNVAIIAAEDPGAVRSIFKQHRIGTPVTSYYRAVQEEKTAILLDQLQNDRSVALVSDEGTPALCDPGAFLISRAHAAGIRVVPVPGVTALMAGVSVTGFGGDTFTFMGMAPDTPRTRHRWLQALSRQPRHLAFFTHPETLKATLQELREMLGNRRMVLVRDLTTPKEQIIRGTIARVLTVLQRRPMHGKLTVVVEGRARGGA